MAELPTGAVTFLFTDIEGSTRLVKQLREDWGDVLGEHQRLLRKAFQSHSGHEVDTQGDSFFVAFANARDAVLAAIDGQLALVSHQWPDGVELKVRMGIHTGQAVASAGRYTGLAVHRAARIGAAAHGGQVLLSQATQALVEDEEDNIHIFLRDLGDTRLKDLDRPVRLYQLAAEGLRADFPPVRHQVADTVRMRRRRVALAAAALVFVAAVVVGTILGTRSTGEIRVRPNSVGIIDPAAAKVVGQVPVGVRPEGIAVGSGAVWIANTADKTVSRVDPRTDAVRRTISVVDTPTGLAIGPDGVWVAHGVSGDVSRVDPSFDTVTKFHVTQPFSGGGLAGSIATGPGTVWAAWGNSAVTRIDPSSGGVLGTIIVGRSPVAIAYGDGAFWVANGDNTVSKLSTQTNRKVGLPIHVGRGPSGIAFGAGDVWVSASVDGTVTRFDPRSGAATPIVVGARPSGIAFGEGAVWVANAGDGTVARIDPRTNAVHTIKVGGSPVGIAVGARRVWITVQTP